MELDGDGALGRTTDEAARGPRRTARTKAAAAAAAPRGSPGGERLVSLVRLDGVTREIGTFVILDRITGAIAPGERVGLGGAERRRQDDAPAHRVGARRARAGRRCVRKRGLSLGLLSQEAHFDEAFMAAPDLRAAVRHGAAHLERMAEELAELEHAGHAAGTDYAELQHRFDILGGYTLDQRVDEALSGLGFARDEWLRPPTALSGGQQTRAALARLVISDPDLMLLDEPTNHLDIGAIEWLEEHLRRRSGALLVASHDRAFLDATVTRVWELRDRRLTVFRGDYTAYHRQRIERDERAEREAESLDDAIAREIELVQRYRSQRKHVKMHEHEARLEKLKAQVPEAPKKSGRSIRLLGAALAGGPVRSGELVVRVEDLAVGYLPGRGALAPDGSEAAGPVTVAKAPFLAAQRGERIGIVGPNGAGKTTLLRTIAGDLPRARRDRRVRPPGVALVPRPAARRGDPRRDGPRRDPRGDPGDARRGTRLPRPVPVPRRRRVQGGADAVGRRAVAAGARAARDPAVEPDAPRRADEPPRHRGARGDRGVPRGVARDAPRRVPRPAAARDDLREAVGRRRRARGAVRRRLPRLARGGRGRLDGARPRRSGARTAIRSGAGATRAGPPPSTNGRARDAGRASPRRPATGVAARRAAAKAPAKARPKLSKDAYRRRREALDLELGRLGLRKSQLELAIGHARP